MNRKTRLSACAGLLAITAATGYGLDILTEQPSAHAQPVTCAASQPVYTDNDYRLVGSWQAALTAGQEVLLPDGDVATCLPDGTLDIAQP